MSATIDTRKAHLTRQHGDLTFIFTWMNDERALVIVPHLRPGAPWYVVMESASFSWDDGERQNIDQVVRKTMKCCEVLGIEGNAHNCRRIAGLIIDSLPDLIRMPSAPPKEYHRASHGSLILRADGQALAAEEIKVEKEGVSYA